MDSQLTAAFAAAPRPLFLPPDQRRYAAVDAPLPIGFGVTNSQPSTVANMLELLDVRPGQKVLDVGSGSGWTTALLAELVGPGGQVYGVDRIEELVQRSTDALQSWPNAQVKLAIPEVFGLPEDGPFDRILVSAMAQEIPADLLAQLKPGGIMVIPVSSHMLRVQKTLAGDLEVSEEGLYSFVPLLP